MRLSLILGVCIVLCGAMVVQATQLPCVGTGNIATGDFTYTRTTTNIGGTALDMLDFYFAAAPTAAAGQNLQVLEGTWNVTGGGVWTDQNLLTGQNFPTTSGFTAGNKSDTTNVITDVGRQNQNYATLYGMSYVNFDSVEAAGNWFVGSLVGNSSTNETSAYSSLEGGWYASTSAVTIAPSPTSLVAQLYVTPGAQVTFNGHYNPEPGLVPGGFGFTGSINQNGSFSTVVVPEPASLFLVASGLVGLLCYAWRKRR